MKIPLIGTAAKPEHVPLKPLFSVGALCAASTYCKSALPIPRLTYAGLHMAMSVPHGNKRQIRITTLFKGQRKQYHQINVLDQQLGQKAETHQKAPVPPAYAVVNAG